MAINVSFNGSTIFKPGAYSKTTIDLGGGFPLSPTGLVAVFGEAEEGTPGANEVDIASNFFTPEQLPEIRSKYASGPIVDACAFLFAPATDGAIPSGAQAVWVYKTNASLRSSLAIANTYGTVRSRKWGANANKITFKNDLTSEVPASATGSAVILPAAVDTAVGLVLSIAVNGATPILHTIAASANRAALLVNLNAAFTSLTFTANVGNKIVVTQNAGTNLQRNGNGRSIEILPTAISTANTALGLTPGLVTPSVEPRATLTLSDKGTLIIESDTLGGNTVLNVGFNSTANDASSATVMIDATNITLTVVGGTQAGGTVLAKSGYSALSELAAAINLLPGWTASLGNALYGQLPLSILDQVSAIGALSEAALKPARIKKDAYEVQSFFALSQEAELLSPKMVGLPDAKTEAFLTGGAKGASLSADMTTALDKFTKIRVNSVVPLFSADATNDMADGLTDVDSTYTILGIHQAVKTHLSLMATTKRRSERQGYLSLKDTYENCKIEASNLADARCQLLIQDIRQVDGAGNIKWFQPWALACLVAGARGGAPIGTPMTFKFMNCSGIRQTGQAMSTAEADIVIDFDPDTQYEDAIQNGITFLEHPQSGGFRIVVDNTTYGKDGNWVYNRANVLYAGDVLAYDFRNQLENIIVGVKNTLKASEVKSLCESILATFLAQGITISTGDAPNGFKGLVVRIVGNTVYIDVVVKLVEGIDFVLAQITLQRASTVA